MGMQIPLLAIVLALMLKNVLPDRSSLFTTYDGVRDRMPTGVMNAV